MTDNVFETKERIWLRVHELVDQMTTNLTEEEDYDVRQALTETFRFWRRCRQEE